MHKVLKFRLLNITTETAIQFMLNRTAIEHELNRNSCSIETPLSINRKTGGLEMDIYAARTHTYAHPSVPLSCGIRLHT